MSGKLRSRVTSEDGFTLAELLVVILVIGILAAMAIPTFLAQRSKGYDASAMGADPSQAKVFLDVGSELVAGAGGVFELAPRAYVAGEVQLFLPLPGTLSYGSCRR